VDIDALKIELREAQEAEGTVDGESIKDVYSLAGIPVKNRLLLWRILCRVMRK